MLPEIAHEINIVNLTSDKDNAGLLDPFVIMKNMELKGRIREALIKMILGFDIEDMNLEPEE